MSRATDTEAKIDLRVLAFTFGVSLLTGILFGIVPALRSLDVALTSALRSKTEGTGKMRYGPFHWNWGKVLVAGQMALSVAVLFAASIVRKIHICIMGIARFAGIVHVRIPA